MTSAPYTFTDEDDDYIRVESSDSSSHTAYIRVSPAGVDVPGREVLKLALAILETAGDTSGAIEDLKTHIEEAESVEKFKEIQKRQMEVLRPYGYTNYSSAPAVVRGLTDKILELEDRGANV